ALAPVRDITPDGSDGLPDRANLLRLLELEPPTAADLVHRWEQRPASTGALLGVGYTGPVVFDLVKDGPHALVAGTTGAGKSELLQSLVASLAAVNRPDEMTFVLVDYKGGSAFRECVRLPHVLGMVTDLDSHLVERALSSLGAELVRRERLLADAGAKDHAEYRAMRRRNPLLPALPRLLLVIDEFATLARDVQEFVPGLVSIAQRGRSLGLHLVLATQRPAGVVTADIRANTNLRIALRVTDTMDSQDVLEVNDAVTISASTPGRALARVGHRSVLPFQTAYVGAVREDAAAAAPAADA
ncbi:cell division protein FtsY, partial [Streptomyces sp. DJ]